MNSAVSSKGAGVAEGLGGVSVNVGNGVHCLPFHSARTYEAFRPCEHEDGLSEQNVG